MHVLLHDFGGYGFPVDLSRELVQRGHQITHAWCASLGTNPGGDLVRRHDDLDLLRFEPVDLGAAIAKYSYLKRWQQERHYGKLLANLVQRVRPDVVLSANTPLDAQASLLKASQALDIPFVFWLQDLIGLATYRLLKARLPVVGAVAGRHYSSLEARILRRSAAVVAITPDFDPLLREWGVAADRITTIENWAPLDDLSVCPKDNAWARSHGLAEDFVFLYTGTMGMKHDPEMIALLAERFLERGNVRVVVLSQGPGAEYLETQCRERGLTNLTVRGYESSAFLPEVMGSADVLVALLNTEAGAFSVPSKVLSYLCGARPLLLAVPPENLAGRVVTTAHAGIVASPTDTTAFLDGATRLVDDGELRALLGANAREFAERSFAIGSIAVRFEKVLVDAASRES